MNLMGRTAPIFDERFAMGLMPGGQDILPDRFTYPKEIGAKRASEQGLYGGGSDPNDLFTSSVNKRLKAGATPGLLDVDPQFQAPIVGLEAHRARQLIDKIIREMELDQQRKANRTPQG